jgi:hypothetical protein
MIISRTQETVEGYRIIPQFFSRTEVNIKYLEMNGRDSKFIHPEYKPQAARNRHIHTYNFKHMKIGHVQVDDHKYIRFTEGNVTTHKETEQPGIQSLTMFKLDK